MTRLNLMLLAALVISALMLVHTAYESRRLFAEIEKAKAETARLEAEHARLMAERQAQATNLRVERLARDRLQMTPVTPAVTQYVVDAAPGAAASALAAPAASRPAASGGRP